MFILKNKSLRSGVYCRKAKLVQHMNTYQCTILCMIISINTENIFDKNPTCFHDNNIQQLKIEDFSQPDEGHLFDIHNLPHIYWRKTQRFLLRSGRQ